MSSCPSCLAELASGSRFCSQCGAPATAAESSAHERRQVTVLFVDLTGSTQLSEQLDPELSRDILRRFFELSAQAIRDHGGSVENFLGDAVLGMFGLRVTHEDDPERAVRAALAARDRVRRLAAEVRSHHDIYMDVHCGIETGEVAVGQAYAAGTAATGDVLNVAARLEQSAPAGEVLVGPATHAATVHAIGYESLGTRQLEGKGISTAVWRVLEIEGEVGGMRSQGGLRAPLLGREAEVSQLNGVASRLISERKSCLVTLLGPPGVGKSRLAREVSSDLADQGWEVLVGKCPPYGQGITFWPLREMLGTACGARGDEAPAEALQLLAASCPDLAVAERLAMAIGLVSTRSSMVDADIPLAMRRWLEARAGERPILLVFEDLHWAEPSLLTMINYILTWLRGVPLMILCLARPELLDRQITWGVGRYEAIRVMLEPLDRAGAGAMVTHLLSLSGPPGPLLERVLERAEGNPLFIEALVGMLVDEGALVPGQGEVARQDQSRELRLPASIESLMMARLDTLPLLERSVLQMAAVIGRTFRRNQLVALAGDAGTVDGVLENVTLRDLVVQHPGDQVDPSFKFRHAVVREVAYGTLSKRRRADLHRHAAELLPGGEARGAEYLEWRAFHREQACLLLSSLLQPDRRLRDLAVSDLIESGRRALRRDDFDAAAEFGRRAVQLRPDREQVALEAASLEMEAFYRQDDYRRAGEAGHRVGERAAQLGLGSIEGRARLFRTMSIVADPEGGATAAIANLRRARDLLGADGDQAYACETLLELGNGLLWIGDRDGALEAWDAATRLAEEAEDRLAHSRVLGRRAVAEMQYAHMESSRRDFESAMNLAEVQGSRVRQAAIRSEYALLVALTEDIQAASRMIAECAPILEEAGKRSGAGWARFYGAQMAWMERRPTEARRLLSQSSPLARASGEVGLVAEVERLSAQVAIDLGENEVAETHALAALEAVTADDPVSRSTSRMALGLVRVAQERFEDGIGLLGEAIQLAEAGPQRIHRWEQYLAMAEAMIAHGDPVGAEGWADRARAEAQLYSADSPLLAVIERRTRTNSQRRRGHGAVKGSGSGG